MSAARAIVLVALLLVPAAAALPALGAWTPAASPRYDGCLIEARDVAFASPTLGVAAANCMSLFVTRDGAASWSRVDLWGDWGEFHGADAANGRLVVVGSDPINRPTVAVSDDAGESWRRAAFHFRDVVEIDAGTNYEGWLEDVRALPDGRIVAAGAVWNGRGAFARSSDGGASWTTTPWTDHALFGLDFDDAGVVGVAVGAQGGAHYSSDGGRTWKQGATGTTVPLLDVAVLGATEAWAVGGAPGGPGVLLRSVDGGASWVTVATVAGTRLHAVSFTGPGEGRVAGADGFVARVVGGLLVPEPAPTRWDVLSLSFPDESVGFASSRGLVMRFDALPLPGPDA